MYDIKNINISKRIKELRIANNLSLEQVGENLQKARSTIYKYEEGTLGVDIETLLQFANLYNVSIESFFDKEKTHITVRDINPFNTNRLYLYYKGKDSIIVSIIEIENLTFQKAIFYNGIKEDSIKNISFQKYTGTLQAEKNNAYFIFETDENTPFEKVLIQVNIPNGETDKYYGYIASDCSCEKCILLNEYISDKEKLMEIADKLVLTEEELETLKKHQWWDIDISYEKDIRNKI